MTVDIVERNSVVPADAKEIWKALTRLFESRMKKKKKKNEFTASLDLYRRSYH